MARRKNPPESVRMKCLLAERLRQVRTELFGERGGPEVARKLSLPIRTWYNYESGVTIPGEVVLRFLELTTTEPQWLLYGRGPKFRGQLPHWGKDTPNPEQSAVQLLRMAVDLLERPDPPTTAATPTAIENPIDPAESQIALESETPHVSDPTGPIAFPDGTRREIRAIFDLRDPARELLTANHGSRFQHALAEIQTAAHQGGCFAVQDQAMAPDIPVGSYACVSAEPDDDLANQPANLNGRIVAAWVHGRIWLRILQSTPPYLVLRAENPAFSPPTYVLDAHNLPPGWKVRRATWVIPPPRPLAADHHHTPTGKL